jgi:hypothetical protein
MCFGGKSNPAPQPAPPSPGVLDVSKATPDPSQAYKYKGDPVGENTTGKLGGPLLLDAANKKTSLGQ